MMNLFGILRSIIVAGLSLCMIASPLAFSIGCSVGGCCCTPDGDEGLAFEKAHRCGCCTIKEASSPILPAVLRAETNIQPMRPEIAISNPDNFLAFDGFYISDQQNANFAQSPPLSISLINAPLIC